MVNLHKLPNENEQQYIWRLGNAKDNGLIDCNWQKLADIINAECRNDETEYLTESAYRKSYGIVRKFYDAGVFGEDCAIDGEDQAYEIKKERRKLFDERNALNKVIREQGRLEDIPSIIKNVIDSHEHYTFEYNPVNIAHGSREMIVHLTDIHCGANINTPVNKFNIDIMYERIDKFLNRIIDIQEMYDCDTVHVIGGGDFVHGIIHNNSRIECKENLVEQIMQASDVISHFLYELSGEFSTVNFYVTPGNHSRAMQNKQDAIRGENFDLLIPYICSKELKYIKNICFRENQYDVDVVQFNSCGYSVWASHGDKDKVDKVVRNMTGYARKCNAPLPDLCYLGHRHKNGFHTVDGVKVIESGCVDSVDQFALDHRLFGNPEQTVVIMSEENCIEAFFDVQLN